MKLVPFIATIVGVFLGGMSGTIAMLFWYINSGDYMGIMAGSGLAVIIIVPIASLYIGGFPGGILGGIVGLVLGIQIEKLFNEALQGDE